MRAKRRATAPALAAAALAAMLLPAEAAAEVAADGAALLEQARAAYRKRAAPAHSAKALELYEKAIAADGGYAALWEGARAAADRGGHRMPGARTGAKRAVFKKGVDWARRAIKMRPGGAEGHIYVSITLGQHARSQSFFHQMGAAGDIRRHAERAVKLNPRVECAVPLRVLGMYYLKLPGAFGGDDRQALKLLARAVKICPNEPDAHLSYAEALEANDRRPEAIKELEWVLAHPARSAADRACYRETKATAEKMLKRLR